MKYLILLLVAVAFVACTGPAGPAGAVGPKGIPGEPGPPGKDDIKFIYGTIENTGMMTNSLDIDVLVEFHLFDIMFFSPDSEDLWHKININSSAMGLVMVSDSVSICRYRLTFDNINTGGEYKIPYMGDYVPWP